MFMKVLIRDHSEMADVRCVMHALHAQQVFNMLGMLGVREITSNIACNAQQFIYPRSSACSLVTALVPSDCVSPVFTTAETQKVHVAATLLHAACTPPSLISLYLQVCSVISTQAWTAGGKYQNRA